MRDKGQALHIFYKYSGIVLGNLLQFIVTLAFFFTFKGLFGDENALVGVALSVGWTIFPKGGMGLRRHTMALMIIGLYTGGCIVGQGPLLPLWAAVPLYAAFTALILLLSTEPAIMKTSIMFLLGFLFPQATCVPWAQFPRRLLGAFAGSLFIAVWTVLAWRKAGLGDSAARPLREHIALCARHRSFILRMSVGIAAAMGLGTVLALPKPLWVSIVVMSLTQIDFAETRDRIRWRAGGTLAGAAAFLLFFGHLIPAAYQGLAVMAMGYLSYFVPAYKYKQVVNAVSALFASLVLLDPVTAVGYRIVCFAGGLAIVLALYGVDRAARRLLPHLKQKLSPA